MLHKSREKHTSSYLTRVFRSPQLLKAQQLEKSFSKIKENQPNQNANKADQILGESKLDDLDDKHTNAPKKNRLSRRAKKVFQTLRKCASDDNTCQVSYTQLTIKSDYCKATVIKAIKELCELRWVEKQMIRDNGGHQANRYTLLK